MTARSGRGGLASSCTVIKDSSIIMPLSANQDETEHAEDSRYKSKAVRHALNRIPI
jgi:hypothetical protein